MHHFEQRPCVSDRRIRQQGGRSGHPGRNTPRSQRPIHAPDVLPRGAQDRDRLVGVAGRRPSLLHRAVHLTHTRREELHLGLDGVEQSDVHPRRRRLTRRDERIGSRVFGAKLGGDLVGHMQDSGSRASVLGERVPRSGALVGAREMLWEGLDVVHAGSTPGVDGLTRISDRGDRKSGPEQRL